MNNVQLIGRLTAEPKTTFTRGKDGKLTVTNFTLAVQRRSSKDDADFIRCVAFGQTADFIDQYFSKGLRVGVTGRIQTGSYENKEGATVYTTDVICENVEFCDSKK